MTAEQERQQQDVTSLMIETDDAEGKQLHPETVEFFRAHQHFSTTVYKEDVPEQTKYVIHGLLKLWNEFLAGKQERQHTDALVSQDIRNDMLEFISPLLNPLSSRRIPGSRYVWTPDHEPQVRYWLIRWDDFLRVRQGNILLYATNTRPANKRVLLYTVDIATDFITALCFAYTGQWEPFAATLGIVYVAAAITTLNKWLVDTVRWTDPLDKLWYWVSLLVNGPDLQECWSLLYMEWALFRFPKSSAHLEPLWQYRRRRVAGLKLNEGVCEACPQVVLQLVLLLPELDGDITWTVSMRLMSTLISLCAAGAALVNTEKAVRGNKRAEPCRRELFVLYMWAVSVAVARLLCLALLLSVHLYWGLACIALHLILYWVYTVYTQGVPRTRHNWFNMCLFSVFFLLSPFRNTVSSRSRTLRHVIHFLGNAGLTVLWALTTCLHYTQPVLYAALISSVFVTFIIGTLGCRLHWKHWALSLWRYLGKPRRTTPNGLTEDN